jgi:hypothetical protein
MTHLRGRGRLVFAMLVMVAAMAGDIASGDEAESGAGDAATTDTDIFDVIRDVLGKSPPAMALEKDRLMVAGAPVVGYNPSTGFSIGFAGNAAFYRGPSESTQISSLVASVNATSKGQLHVNAKVDASTADNTWNLVGDNRLYWTSQTTFGLGTSTTEDQALDMAYDYFRFHEILYREVRDNVFVGAGVLFGRHQDTRPNVDAVDAFDPEDDSPYVLYSNARGFDLETQTSAGGSLHLLFNSRDSSINPSRGVYASVGYQMFIEDFLGGSSTWQQLNYDLRTYVPLASGARHTLAFWTFGNLVTGGDAPYLDLPATAWDTYGRSGRAYVQGRFRGDKMLYGEIEYRWMITRNRLLGLVVFLNTQTLSNPDSGEKLFDSFASATGFGLRLLINKHSKTNLAVDIGKGETGDRNVYIGVQEAF